MHIVVLPETPRGTETLKLSGFRDITKLPTVHMDTELIVLFNDDTLL